MAMPDPLLEPDSAEDIAFSQASMHAILSWLDGPPLNAADQLPALHNHLIALRKTRVSRQQRTFVLERLYTRSISVASDLLPALSGISLPLPWRIRQRIRRLQNVLRVLSEELLYPPTQDERTPVHDASDVQEIALWRCLYALAQHLLLSALAASPAEAGIWRQLHQAYETALRLGIDGSTPVGTAASLRDIYHSAILLGCAQTTSFTAREVEFVAAYLRLFGNRIEPTAAATLAAFWIDPALDVPAIPWSRKTAPPDIPVRHFSCDRLAALLKEQMAALETGATAQQAGLPPFAGTPSGRRVLRRLATHWGEPGKRRFPRRRQTHRAVLCNGLESLCRLFQEGDAATIERSVWMIRNESADGYAVMHISGETGRMSLGDVIAIRFESSEDWQICVVRWALSESHEHLELGLQTLATRALPAVLAVTGEIDPVRKLSVLWLPEIRALHASERLVVASGELKDASGHLVLVIEKENIAVREVRRTRVEEQNNRIDVFSIGPDMLSA